MNLLRIIKDQEIPIDESNLIHREASRAVIMDEQHNVPLLFVASHNFHKLPGGGIEPGESRIAALLREVMEEVGCQIDIAGEVGQIIEYRSQFNLKQISDCYIGIIKTKGTPNFTPKEIGEGFRVEWQSIDEAITKMRMDAPSNYEGSFIRERDRLFLENAKIILDI